MMSFSNPLNSISPAKLALMVRRMREKAGGIDLLNAEPIAIIGIGCRFPGGVTNADQYWQLLRSGTDAITEVPQSRIDKLTYYNPYTHSSDISSRQWGGFLEDVDLFDASFFGISPREVITMDPQHRLLLEVAWEALECAGQAPDRLVGTSTGVFVGIGSSDYGQLQVALGDPTQIGLHFGTGSSISVAAGRLSYFFGLQGPTLSVDTACSSSLVAVHLACQSLHAGECDLAISGGVNLILSPLVTLALTKMQFLAPDGRCKTFDATANGFVRSEGCGVVILKRFSDALSDGDNILAVIRGSALNHDGRSGGVTVPNGSAQQQLIRDALSHAGLKPAQIDYIESHGTGTALGDPIELNALHSVMNGYRPQDKPLIVGAVKSNIGHLEAAAGIAGLIKVVMALQHKEFPPNLHLHTFNPHMSQVQESMHLPTELEPWLTDGKPRIAGVSAFGFSGTNAHIVLEEFTESLPVDVELEPPGYLLSLSAQTKEALMQLVQRFEQYLSTASPQSIGDICFTAHTGRAHFPHRLAVVAEDTQQLQERLSTFRQGQNSPSIVYQYTKRTTHQRLAFLYTGQGSQYADMGLQLYQVQPVFREVLDQCNELLTSYLPHSLLSVLYGENRHLLNETAYTQPALFAIEYALTELWKSWGVMPSVVMGHSIGEYVAACVAGIFSLQDGLRLAAERGRLMQALPQDGAMISVSANVELVETYLLPYKQSAAIAAINGPRSTVISGAKEVIQSIAAELEKQGIKTKPLAVSHAFHSPLMHPMIDSFRAIATSVSYSPPHRGIISNVTGKFVNVEVICKPEYWLQHIQETVQFEMGMQTLQGHGYDTFVEIGPHPTLIAMSQDWLSAGVFIASLRKDRHAWQHMLHALSILYTHGATIDWSGFEQPYARRRVILPTYPFERQRYWLPLNDVTPQRQTSQALLETVDLDQYAYELQWLPQSWHQEKFTLKQDEQWIILADRSGVGQALAAQLALHGVSSILVFAAQMYKKDTSNTYEINPTLPENYQQLWQAVQAESQAQGQKHHTIIHLWSLDTTPTDTMTIESLQCELETNASSVPYLLQSLQGLSMPQVKIWLCTCGAMTIKAFPSAPSLVQAPLWGLGRVVGLEHPELWGGLIDLDPAGTIADNAFTIVRVLQESDGEDQVAARTGIRYVARLLQYTSRDNKTQPATLRQDGTYIITGGLGELGFRVACRLAQQGARTLVLIGRKALPERAHWSALLATQDDAITQKITQIQQLEQAGVVVHIVQADVSDCSRMSEVFAELARTLPPVRGIVHAAGSTGICPILSMSLNDLKAMFLPKVTGTWILHQLTANMELDFLLSFSSIASVWGGAGLGHYAAANHFLDSYAAYRRFLGLPAISVNWGPWSDGGMASPQFLIDMKRIGIGSLAPQQAIAMLGRLLTTELAQIVIADVNWSLFKPIYQAKVQYHLLDQLQGRRQYDTGAEPELLRNLKGQSAGKQKGIILAYITALSKQVLALSPEETIDPDQGFFEMGMDSIMAVELRNSLQVGIGTTSALPPTLLFNYPSITALSGYVLAEICGITPVEGSIEQDHARRIQMQTEVAQLSEEEAEAHLLKQLESTGY